MPVDSQGIVTSAIPNDAGFVFVTPSHHCPTMVPLSAPSAAQDLLARASRNNQIIIEDGYDSQLLDDAPQQALKSLDRSGPRHLCRLDVEDARAGPAARLHRRARPD